MRTPDEIRAERKHFDNELAVQFKVTGSGDEQLETIIDVLNWVLGDTESLDEYKSI